MRKANLLLASTALGLLTLSATPSSAQNADVTAAYQAYASARLAVVDAQNNGGDLAAAIASAQSAQADLSAACAAAGTPDLAACLDQNVPADQRIPGDLDPLPEAPAAAPAEQPAQDQAAPAEQPAQEEAAPADNQAAPAEQPAEEPAPASDQQAAPAEQPAQDQAAPSDQPAQSDQAAPADQPAQNETAPADNQTAPAEQPAAESAPASDQQAAPAEQPAQDQAAPSDQQAAPSSEPAPQPETKPAEEAAPQPADKQGVNADVQAGAQTQAAPAESPELQSAYKTYADARSRYDAAIADGKDATDAANEVNAAFASIVSICQELGADDVSACLDQYIAADARIENDTSGVKVPDNGQAAASEPKKQAPKLEEQTNAQGQALEPVAADSNISKEELAPLLDSAKEPAQPATTDSNAAASTSSEGNAEAKAPASNDSSASASNQPAAAAAPSQPAPTSDQDAQANIQTTQVQSARAERGQRLSGDQANVQTQAAPDNAKVVDQNGLRIIVQLGDQLVVRNRDDDRRLRHNASDRYVEDLGHGRTRETIERRDGSQVVTIYNRNGDIIRRSLFDKDGTEYVMVYTPQDREQELLDWRDPGQDLPPLQLDIPARDYILDAEYADEKQVANFLDQPPVERVQRLYSVDEVKRSARIRDMVRRLEIGDLTFDSGRATISPSQIGSLNKVANAMLDLLDQNPAETFLIEGHTDAVGSDISNLELSDRRAETVANVLTQVYGIPPENLATQGYGERFLKIRTQDAERANRRVTIKRITPLVSPVASR